MPTITTATEVYHVHPTQLDQVLALLGELDSPESNGRPHYRPAAADPGQRPVRNQRRRQCPG